MCSRFSCLVLSSFTVIVVLPQQSESVTPYYSHTLCISHLCSSCHQSAYLPATCPHTVHTHQAFFGLLPGQNSTLQDKLKGHVLNVNIPVIGPQVSASRGGSVDGSESESLGG